MVIAPSFALLTPPASRARVGSLDDAAAPIAGTRPPGAAGTQDALLAADIGHAPTSQAERGADELSIGQLNAWNLFDTRDDPFTRDDVLDPKTYQTRLTKLALAIRDSLHGADLISLQEIENPFVLEDLTAHPELKEFGYEAVVPPGNDARGIRNGLLYRAGRVEVLGARSPNPVPREPLKDGYRGQLNSALTYARAPLVVDLRLRGARQTLDGVGELTVVVNHFKSKIGGERYEARRALQGAYVGGIVDGIRREQPNRPVVVVGDLNAGPGEAAYDDLVAGRGPAARLHSAVDTLPKAERYSYVYRGKPSLLDHILVSPDLKEAVSAVEMARIGTPEGARDKAGDPSTAIGASDHDGIYARLDLSKVAAG